jgi:hypothetical protein
MIFCRVWLVCRAKDRRCFSIWLRLFGPESTILCHWPPKSQRFETKTMHYTTIDTPKFRTHDHSLHHHWPQKYKDSNQRPCTTPPLIPLRQRFEPQIIRTASRMKYNSCVDSVSLCRITDRPDCTYNSCVDSVSLCRITDRPDCTKWWRHTKKSIGIRHTGGKFVGAESLYCLGLFTTKNSN